MYKDDIKKFSRNEKELETVIHAYRIYSENIWHWTMYHANYEKLNTTNNSTNQLRNQVKIRILEEKKTDKHLGILEVDTIKHAQMKEKTKKKILQGNEKTNRNKTSEKKSRQRNK